MREVARPAVRPGERADDVTWAPLPLSELARGQRRLEGEAYLTGGYAIRCQIEASGIPSSRVGELAHVWQPSRLKGIAVPPAHGVPFLTATQVFDIRPVPRKWLAPSRTEDLKQRYLQPGWILATCSGSVGDAIISHSPHADVIVSHDLLRVQVRDSRTRGYFYAFLRSRFARAMLRSSQYGSIIKHLEVEHLQEVPVPAATERLYSDLNDRIDRVFLLRDDAFRLTGSAQARYAAEIGVTPEPAADETAFSVRASEIFAGARRIDGYHYNPRANAVLVALRATGRPLEALGSVTERILLPQRFRRRAADHGIPYLGSQDIFKVNPEITKFIPEATKQDAADYFVERGWILVARSGQLYGINGNAILADRWHEDKIISEDVIRVVPNQDHVRPGYLQMVLSHPVFGRPLVLRLAFGTEVPHIPHQLLADLPVLRLKPTVEDAIADDVERASALRMDANEEEDEAVKMVQGYVEHLLAQKKRRAKPGH